MTKSTLLGVTAAAMMVLAAGQALAQCAPGAIGISRQVEIDATGAPRFGHLQYQGPDFLQPGEVVLTFDDGPHKALTPVILSALDQHCTKATFFMLGQRAMMYSDLVKEVLRHGHTIGTHTWSHANLKHQSADGAVAEIELGISGVQKALGVPAAPFFRFPYLSDPHQTIAYLKTRNTAIFSIDVDSKDFRTRSPTVVMRNVMQQLKAKGRGIILFHDIQPSTAGALGALLTDLKASGYRVVHLVPARGQVTLADFDRRVGSPTHNVAGLGVPIAHRTAVSPAWEPRAARPAAANDAYSAGAQGGAPAGSLVQPQAPVAAKAAPALRPRDGDDWRTSVFRGY
jgi:peptidoglycan/xylan/chitin deacetylase (PgdA/CDA1 family)